MASVNTPVLPAPFLSRPATEDAVYEDISSTPNSFYDSAEGPLYAAELFNKQVVITLYAVTGSEGYLLSYLYVNRERITDTLGRTGGIGLSAEASEALAAKLIALGRPAKYRELGALGFKGTPKATSEGGSC